MMSTEKAESDSNRATIPPFVDALVERIVDELVAFDSTSVQKMFKEILMAFVEELYYRGFAIHEADKPNEGREPPW